MKNTQSLQAGLCRKASVANIQVRGIRYDAVLYKYMIKAICWKGIVIGK